MTSLMELAETIGQEPDVRGYVLMLFRDDESCTVLADSAESENAELLVAGILELLETKQ